MKAVIVTETDGTMIRFGSLVECGEHYGVSSDLIWKRIHGMIKNERRKFEYEEKPKKEEASKPKKREGYKKRPFAPKSHKVIEYKTKGIAVCITPCRYRLNVMVGSAGCQRCSLFRGRDKEKHIVACAQKGKYDLLSDE